MLTTYADPGSRRPEWASRPRGNQAAAGWSWEPDPSGPAVRRPARASSRAARAGRCGTRRPPRPRLPPPDRQGAGAGRCGAGRCRPVGSARRGLVRAVCRPGRPAAGRTVTGSAPSPHAGPPSSPRPSPPHGYAHRLAVVAHDLRVVDRDQVGLAVQVLRRVAALAEHPADEDSALRGGQDRLVDEPGNCACCHSCVSSSRRTGSSSRSSSRARRSRRSVRSRSAA